MHAQDMLRFSVPNSAPTPRTVLSSSNPNPNPAICFAIRFNYMKLSLTNVTSHNMCK